MAPFGRLATSPPRTKVENPSFMVRKLYRCPNHGKLSPVGRVHLSDIAAAEAEELDRNDTTT